MSAPDDDDEQEPDNAPRMGRDDLEQLLLEGNFAGDDFEGQSLEADVLEERPPARSQSPAPRPAPSTPTPTSEESKRGLLRLQELFAVLKQAAKGITAVRLGALPDQARRRGVVAIVYVNADGERTLLK